MNQLQKNATNSEKPYDRFLFAGAEALSDAELLAVILRTGRKGADAVTVAREILSMAGTYGLAGLYHLTLEDLKKIPGVGEVKAIKLKCIAELSNRIVRFTKDKLMTLSTPHEIADYYMERLRHFEKETCLAVFLDGSMHLIKDSVISIGSVNMSLVSVREIFLEALSAKAVYMILLHNHPSGNPKPSRADISITQKLYDASKLMDIPLMDHIVIGDNTFYSFRENGLIQ